MPLYFEKYVIKLITSNALSSEVISNCQPQFLNVDTFLTIKA